MADCDIDIVKPGNKLSHFGYRPSRQFVSQVDNNINDTHAAMYSLYTVTLNGLMKYPNKE